MVNNPAHHPPPTTPLFLLSLAIGLLLGLFVRATLDGGDPWSSSQTIPSPGSGSSSFLPADPTTLSLARMEVALHQTEIALLLPTPTSTPYPAPVPTRDPLYLCATATPGVVCRVPRPAAQGMTPTPYPSCARLADLAPGTICMWPTSTPVPTPTPLTIGGPFR